MEKPCINCGKTVVRPPAHFRKVKHVYCSAECRREYAAKRKQKTCPQCGNVFVPAHHHSTYCSPQCAGLAARGVPKKPQPQRQRRVELTCPVCGKTFWRHLSHAARYENPTCSSHCNGVLRGQEWKEHAHKGRAAWTEESEQSYREKMSGPNNPAWKGGATYRKRKGNYPQSVKYVRCPQEFASMARKDGYVMEHRLIMAQHVGRPLLRSEVVHHINHDVTDNRIENLQLFASNGEHKRHEGETGYFKDYYGRNHTTPRSSE